MVLPHNTQYLYIYRNKRASATTKTRTCEMKINRELNICIVRFYKFEMGMVHAMKALYVYEWPSVCGVIYLWKPSAGFREVYAIG